VLLAILGKHLGVVGANVDQREIEIIAGSAELVVGPEERLAPIVEIAVEIIA
jgi:hypothetical protein